MLDNAILDNAARYRRVLITGGAGFIGGHLASALSRSGCRVRVLDDFSSGTRDTVAALPGVEIVTGSVLDADVVTDAAAGCGLIVHMAGVVGMRLATAQAWHAFRVAAEGTATLLRHSGDTPIVLVSSSAVYGMSDSGAPMCDDATVGRSVPLRYDGGREGYATGKWELERLGARAAARRPVLVVRPFNVVGPGQSSRYGMVLPTFVEQALAGRPLTVHGDGTQRRCFTDIDQFVGRLWRLIESPGAWQAGTHVYNIGADVETGIGDLAALVLAETGSASGVTHVPYEQVFPGRTDVVRRVPAQDRFASVIGPTEWLPVAAIVAKAVAERKSSAERQSATAGADSRNNTLPH